MAPALLSDDRVNSLCEASADKMAALRQRLKSLGSAVVAFSGGVDSTFLLAVAAEELGEKCVAFTAVSASIGQEEIDEARALAGALGVRHVLEESKELDDPRYASNPSNRCYFCKNELFTLTDRARVSLGVAVVLDGFNADDKKDHRPGHVAAREHEVRSPLAEAGLTKDEIRAWSKRLGLSTWDKPQLACLASRLPYGTQVTVQRLTQVGKAEAALRELGLRVFRVRYHGEVARLEVSLEELPRLGDLALRARVNEAVKAAGFTFVAIDLEPFRSGRLNDALKERSLALPVIS